MILLSTNAENIFWLGRYLTRTQYLCAQFPFTQDQPAMDYAHAFCLPAFDACSLNELILNPNNPASFNQLFQSAKSNVQDLRGILSAKAYAELNQFIKNATENTAYICDVVGECQDVLESEASDVFLFFSLGQMIEQLDRQIRLKQDAQNTLVEIENIVMLLKEMGWLNLAQAWLELKSQPDAMNFYHFSDYIQQLFEVDV
ncbi:MAG: alpha-E domain-containing protein [Acinetobacter johnsonii]|uniref:alpha-E domain-containing protein n=1 Tax=Acinetobacter johnsonii TaxID=40214 RepID=UPI002D80995B|nr:alpha-E domain-containing protein [Acinetobacter johnsonii]